MAQAIKSTSNAAGLSLARLKAEASALQKDTIFGDEEILNKSTAQLLTFTNIANDEFLRAQKVALDLSTVLDGDLQGASIQLGKALNDPVANLSALSRSGIQFSKDQKEVIKSLAESGQLAEAQGIILEELERQYGGQAKAAVVGAGAIQQFNHTIGDIKEQVGGFLVGALGPLVKGLGDLIAPTQLESDLLREQQIEVNTLTGILMDETAAQETKAEVLRQLQEIQPDLVKGISAEAVNSEELTKRLAALNTQYEKRIRLALAQEKVNALLKQQEEFTQAAVQAELAINKAFANRFGIQAQSNKTTKEQIEVFRSLGNQGIILEAQLGLVEQREAALKRASDLLTEAQTDLSGAQANAGDAAQTAAPKVDNLKTKIEGTGKASKGASDSLKQFRVDVDGIVEGLGDEPIVERIFGPDSGLDVAGGLLPSTEDLRASLDGYKAEADAWAAQNAGGEEVGLFNAVFGDPKEFLTSALDTASAIIGIISQFQEAATQKRLGDLEREKQARLQSAGEDAAAREQIEAQYQARKEEIERQAAVKRKRIAIAEAVIQTALNIIKTLSNPFQAALVAAAGAAQIAVISAQQFATGVFDLKGPGSETSDSIPAWLSRGESVIPAKHTRAHPEATRALVEGKFDKWMAANMALRPGILENTYGGNVDLSRQISRLEKSLTRAIQRLPVSVTAFDSRGFTQFVAGGTTWKYHLGNNG